MDKSYKHTLAGLDKLANLLLTDDKKRLFYEYLESLYLIGKLDGSNESIGKKSGLDILYFKSKREEYSKGKIIPFKD